jgi:isopropylmalate/homocitrate/citramalate synthase
MGSANDRVLIFDATLRDGEQSPSASMNLEEKREIALLLEEMGVGVIEGFNAIKASTLVASAKPYVHALNKLLVTRRNQAPAAISA